MASYKFIGGDGKTYGPFPLEKLRQFVAENRLNTESQVRKDDGPFAPASAFPELLGSPAPSTSVKDTPPIPASGTPRNSHPMPGKVQAIHYFSLIGGIIAIIGGVVVSVIYTFSCCALIPFGVYNIVAGVLALIQGTKLMGKNPGPYYPKQKKIAILQIICIINLDVVNLTVGILTLVFLNDEEVKSYMQSQGAPV